MIERNSKIHLIADYPEPSSNSTEMNVDILQQPLVKLQLSQDGGKSYKNLELDNGLYEPDVPFYFQKYSRTVISEKYGFIFQKTVNTLPNSSSHEPISSIEACCSLWILVYSNHTRQISLKLSYQINFLNTVQKYPVMWEYIVFLTAFCERIFIYGKRVFKIQF